MGMLKKLASMILALTMVFSMGTSAYAANATDHTITINNQTSGYTYVAYQVFKGDLVDGQLQNIEWGNNIDDADALMTNLNNNQYFADCESAVDVATKLAENQDADNDVTKAFADIVAGHLAGTVAGASGYSEANEVYTIPVKGDGYYLVENTEVPTNASYTRYILQVVGNVTVNHKGTVPVVVKKIVMDTNKVDANTADIGDTVNYDISGTMPSNIADYDTYYYVFTDTLSKGLTYTDNLKVTVNGQDVTSYFYANATVNGDGSTTLTVGIQDILALQNLENVGAITANTQVIVSYTALVNNEVEVGVNGTTNDVILTFSNDPNNDGDGTTTPPPTNPDQPAPATPTGVTPKDTVVTFTTEIQLTKVDGLDNTKILTGAKFSISGVSSNVKIINMEMYVPYAAGEAPVADNVWYMLKNGTYTATAPVQDNPETQDVNEDTTAAYDDVTKTYKKVNAVSTDTITTPFVAEGWVNADGQITFTGLGEGTYTITEIDAPDGYNLLTEPITVKITSNVGSITPSTAATITWSATNGADGNELVKWNVSTDGVVKIAVANTSGSTLPATGGMGTTVFYIVGGVLVLAAIVLLVTKKRMGSNK